MIKGHSWPIGWYPLQPHYITKQKRDNKIHLVIMEQLDLQKSLNNTETLFRRIRRRPNTADGGMRKFNVTVVMAWLTVRPDKATVGKGETEASLAIKHMNIDIIFDENLVILNKQSCGSLESLSALKLKQTFWQIELSITLFYH